MLIGKQEVGLVVNDFPFGKRGDFRKSFQTAQSLAYSTEEKLSFGQYPPVVKKLFPDLEGTTLFILERTAKDNEGNVTSLEFFYLNPKYVTMRKVGNSIMAGEGR